MFEEYAYEFYLNHFFEIRRGKTAISLDDIAEHLKIEKTEAVRFLNWFIENGFVSANFFDGAYPITSEKIRRSTWADCSDKISCLELEILMILTMRDEEMSFYEIASKIARSMPPCFYVFCEKSGRGYSGDDIETITKEALIFLIEHNLIKENREGRFLSHKHIDGVILRMLKRHGICNKAKLFSFETWGEDIFDSLDED